MSSNDFQKRNYVFTAWSKRDLEPLIDLSKYIIYGKEICPETHRLHYQGYMQLHNKLRLRTLVKLVPGPHYEPQMGTVQQAIDYCKKDNDFTEHGEVTLPKQRTDLKLASKFCKENTMKDFAEEYPTEFIRYNKGFTNLKQLFPSQERNWPMDVRCYWGPTRTGKTRKVYDDFDTTDIYKVPQSKTNVWFTPKYQGQTVCLFDDFDPSTMSIQYFLNITDRYPMEVEIKGGFTEFTSAVIIFTSNSNPELWYQCDQHIHDAFMARFTEINHMT